MSGVTTPTEATDTLPYSETPAKSLDSDMMLSLEALQNDEQRRVLDIVVQIRKCGLEGTLSLPQIVVCGDQSAGKSSVLEAITRVPFPRNDGLCTRYATEISLRRAASSSLTIKVIPDKSRPSAEQEQIKKFEEAISNFDDLPRVMELAKSVMGIAKTDDVNSSSRAFARDVLSIEIAGPSQPQLTLVDIPGLIATSTRGVTKADVDMVTEITDYYIEQPRTICLAVVCATNDYANQKILEKKNFIDLANNEDIFFKLGWHVLKNRSYEERDFTSEQRDLSEEAFFRTRAWKTLSSDCLGVETLRARLCSLLFDHIKRELPKLKDDLETQLLKTRSELRLLGARRSTTAECRAYLSQTSLNFFTICKSAINGHYDGEYFQSEVGNKISTHAPFPLSRTRAVIQAKNTQFAENIRVKGHKYQINMSQPAVDDELSEIQDSDMENGCAENDDADECSEEEPEDGIAQSFRSLNISDSPIELNTDETMEWIGNVIQRTRGRELPGTLNGLVVPTLFWEQSSKWEELASLHIEDISIVCRDFLRDLLQGTCPKDIEKRVWSSQIEPELKKRQDKAEEEFQKLVAELKKYPINYNHYFTDTITKRRQQREDLAKERAPELATSSSINKNGKKSGVGDRAAAVANSTCTKADMDEFACEEALDHLCAIYKLQQKVFVANVTVQVIERHIVGGIEDIFSPVVVNNLETAQVQELALEPATTRRLREYLVDQVHKLEEGYKIFRRVM